METDEWCVSRPSAADAASDDCFGRFVLSMLSSTTMLSSDDGSGCAGANEDEEAELPSPLEIIGAVID